jgi:hypothetical protein
MAARESRYSSHQRHIFFEQNLSQVVGIERAARLHILPRMCDIHKKISFALPCINRLDPMSSGLGVDPLLNKVIFANSLFVWLQLADAVRCEEA